MLPELKFVKAAVAKKDLIPALTHFRIENGTVRSFNGTIALSTPIQFDIDCTPKAEPFVRAISNCSETIKMTITPTGKLSVKSGKFRALIDCLQEETPHVEPDGDIFDIDGEALLKAFKALLPFVGEDAARPWSNGILLKGHSAYATNNVCAVEYWVGTQFPIECNVPSAAIREVVRIGEAPTHAQATQNSISFHFPGNRWIRTALFEPDKWPDINKVLDRASNATPIPEGFFDAIEAVRPFVEKTGRLHFVGNMISTSLDMDEGACHEVEGLDMHGMYHVDMISLLQGVATSADFNGYPAPCTFFGHMLRGVIVGLRPL